jgi:hypothetical protein
MIGVSCRGQERRAEMETAMNRIAFADIFSLDTPLSDIIGSFPYATNMPEGEAAASQDEDDTKLARLIAKRRTRRTRS